MENRGVGDGTVGKALEVLDIVVDFGRAVRFSELLEVSTYPKATLHRFLQSLTNQGMLHYDETRHTYSPGLRLARLADLAWKQASLAPVARPFLEALSHDVGQTVHLAQMVNSQVIFIDKHRPPEGSQTLAQRGRLSPAHCTGVGKAMLAFMEPEALERALLRQSFERFTPTTHGTPETLVEELRTIREQGIAFDRQEHEQGIMSIAAPIFGSSNRIIGAISVVTSALKMPFEDLETFRPALQRTAGQIGKEAALWPYPAAQ